MRWCFRKACCNDIWQTTSNISTKMLDQKSLESNNNNKDTKCTPNCKQRATQAKNYELVLKRTREQFENERWCFGGNGYKGKKDCCVWNWASFSRAINIGYSHGGIDLRGTGAHAPSYEKMWKERDKGRQCAISQFCKSWSCFGFHSFHLLFFCFFVDFFCLEWQSLIISGFYFNRRHDLTLIWFHCSITQLILHSWG